MGFGRKVCVNAPEGKPQGLSPWEFFFRISPFLGPDWAGLGKAYIAEIPEQINFEKVDLLWRPRSIASWTPAREPRSVPCV